MDTPSHLRQRIAPCYTGYMTKGERREAKRQKRRYGMRVDGAQVRRVQLVLLQRQQASGRVDS